MPPVGYRKQVEDALPGTYNEIIAKSGLPRSTVKRWIGIMHAERAVYVADWRRSTGGAACGGQFMPYWRAGKRKDKPCTLKRLTSAETSTAWRNKARRDGSWAELKARYNGRKWEKKTKQRGDPLINALFGRAPVKG